MNCQFYDDYAPCSSRMYNNVWSEGFLDNVLELQPLVHGA